MKLLSKKMMKKAEIETDMLSSTVRFKIIVDDLNKAYIGLSSSKVSVQIEDTSQQPFPSPATACLRSLRLQITSYNKSRLLYLRLLSSRQLICQTLKMSTIQGRLTRMLSMMSFKSQSIRFCQLLEHQRLFSRHLVRSPRLARLAQHKIYRTPVRIVFLKH